MNMLVIIPARGGSKGIPKKNIRPLNGKPLIYYQIQNALKSNHKPDVYVSSEDEEILNIAQKFGAKIHKRDANLSLAETTIDPVVFDAVEAISNQNNKGYSLVVVLQPTSPLLKVETLDAAIQRMINAPWLDTIISASYDTHLTWRYENGKYMPNFEKRANRQYLPKVFRENGAFTISRRSVVKKTSRFGNSVDLCLLNGSEAVDIDSFEDWNLCEYYLKRKTILFVVTGYPKIGLGHVYNLLILANHILNHRVVFLVDKKSKLAYDKIFESNYEVHMQQHDNLLDDVLRCMPDVVINDILDTTEEYMQQLKAKNLIVINFEDLGPGSKYADLVFNAIYPEKQRLENHYFGPQYVLLRDEFFLCPNKVISDTVKNVLVTFGGVDPNNYTRKVVESIYEYCMQKHISIKVVAGLGYSQYESLLDFKEIRVCKNSNYISEYMLEADIAFTSAGRTTYELASIGTPAIILAQNQREQTHIFASNAFGFENLGLGYRIDNKLILKVFKEITTNRKKRISMSEMMQSVDVCQGRKKVVELIQGTIGGLNESS